MEVPARHRARPVIVASVAAFLILWWEDKSRITFQTQLARHVRENELRDDECVAVEHMGHTASQREQQESEPSPDAGQEERRS